MEGKGSGTFRNFRMRPSEQSRYWAAVAMLRYSAGSADGALTGGADAALG
jgi:hypothetical protein